MHSSLSRLLAARLEDEYLLDTQCVNLPGDEAFLDAAPDHYPRIITLALWNRHLTLALWNRHLRRHLRPWLRFEWHQVESDQMAPDMSWEQSEAILLFALPLTDLGRLSR